ncbi:Glucosyltransferase-like protein [Blyttiomyces sp. JEL0837]|nr:Glucosyltransferase-like protein [Blyttiomyces sp. JEL0837]
MRQRPTTTSSSSSSAKKPAATSSTNHSEDVFGKIDPSATSKSRSGQGSYLALTSPAREWVSLLDRTDGKHLAITVSLLFSTLIKWIVSLNGYSGMGTPPMFGDFEAQRHWLEITYHLPPSKWYRYDLQYWGLDYPPLTAYHSWLLGSIANLINPNWVALDKSRGFEGYQMKLFMRYTALFTDLIIYSSAVIFFVKKYIPQKDWVSKNTLALLILLQPALIIIDHGHFQYNSAMLGFALWAVVCMMNERFVLGGIFFCLSLNFKQMALYYALPFFFYLLGKCFKHGISLFIQLGVSVIITFAICFAPFLGSIEDVQQVFVRMFPVQRGLYEDKVANLWCALSVVVKLRQMFELEKLVLIRLVNHKDE